MGNAGSVGGGIGGVLGIKGFQYWVEVTGGGTGIRGGGGGASSEGVSDLEFAIDFAFFRYVLMSWPPGVSNESITG